MMTFRALVPVACTDLLASPDSVEIPGQTSRYQLSIHESVGRQLC
jgi:hypothetical protein